MTKSLELSDFVKELERRGLEAIKNQPVIDEEFMRKKCRATWLHTFRFSLKGDIICDESGFPVGKFIDDQFHEGKYDIRYRMDEPLFRHIGGGYRRKPPEEPAQGSFMLDPGPDPDEPTGPLLENLNEFSKAVHGGQVRQLRGMFNDIYEKHHGDIDEFENNDD